MKSSENYLIHSVLHVTLLVSLTLSPLAIADSSTRELLDLLLKKGIITEAEHEEISNVYSSEAQTDKSEQVDASDEKPASEKPKVVVSDKAGLTVETTDGNFAFQVGGRVQVDAALYDQDERNLGNGTELRRSRLFAAGTLFEDWDFKGQYDFAGNSVGIDDAYIRYTGFSPFNITIGNFKQPFSLDNITSSKYITFTERALPHEAFVPGRRIGLGINTSGAEWSAAVGVFGETVSGDAGDEDTGDNEGDSGLSLASRLTYAPISSDRNLLHAGGSFYYRGPGDGESVRFRTRPESHVTSVRLVDTGTVSNVEDVFTYGIESTGIFGPASLQGEYLLTNVQRDSASDLDFDGWYLQGSYFLTGESRAASYKTSSGSFSRIKPANSLGAWELALRYSTIDLDDGGLDGGEQDNITLGLNWYANSHLRFSANYVHANSDRAGAEDDPDIFQFRSQVDF